MYIYVLCTDLTKTKCETCHRNTKTCHRITKQQQYIYQDQDQGDMPELILVGVFAHLTVKVHHVDLQTTCGLRLCWKTLPYTSCIIQRTQGLSAFAKVSA